MPAFSLTVVVLFKIFQWMHITPIAIQSRPRISLSLKSGASTELEIGSKVHVDRCGVGRCAFVEGGANFAYVLRI